MSKDGLTIAYQNVVSNRLDLETTCSQNDLITRRLDHKTI